ncbi:MAG: pyridoxal-phosphate dependent enzyme [Bryobacterales bacterium]|nr:pyridoxal-phosphate dependent enzyme [Bryobacterales bacterium]
MSITIDDIRAAAARIGGIAHRTPVMTSRTFNANTGVEAFFKCENLQRGGAFKIRGASNAVLALKPARVVAYSSGNHAQAVAIAARETGIPATIVMPNDAPKSKVEATRGYGAEVVIYDRLRENRVAIGERIAKEQNAAIIPPYDHPLTMAGQGTAALELLEEIAGLDALAVCVGGGGLISGCATAAKALNPNIRVFGVEPEDGNDTWQSLRAGHQVEIPPPATIADGLRAQSPGKLTFPVVQKLVEDVVLVSDDEIKAAMKFALLRMKLVIEPSGAVAMAAVMHAKLPKDVRRVGIIVSGGNVDYEVLAAL